MAIVGVLIGILVIQLTFGIRAPALPERRKRTNVVLDSEADVDNYLLTTGRSAVIWRCKNQVLVQWHAKVVPYFDVECEVLGDVRTVEWLHSKTVLETGSRTRYTFTSTPHIKHGYQFQRWLHYKLRVHWATEEDSGVYVLRVAGPRDEVSEDRRVHVRITTEYNMKQMPSKSDDKAPKTGVRQDKARTTADAAAARRKQRQLRLKNKTRRDRRAAGLRAKLEGDESN